LSTLVQRWRTNPGSIISHISFEILLSQQYHNTKPHHLLPHPQISTLAALAYHKSTGRTAARPNQRLGFAENFLYMLDRCVVLLFCCLFGGQGRVWL
jgi:citrate synthase